jgi:hypothetical protein
MAAKRKRTPKFKRWGKPTAKPLSDKQLQKATSIVGGHAGGVRYVEFVDGREHFPPIIPREPRPLFSTGRIVPVATAVCESGAAYVFGYEWGPDSKAVIGPGWIYWLIEAPRGGFQLGNDGRPIVSGRRFAASEAEMCKWHKELDA